MLGDVPDGISALMKEILHTFDDFSATGCMIAGEPLLLYKAEIQGILGDEKGMKEVFASKGHGGTRPCLHCKNIVQFIDVSTNAYLRPISCPLRSEFDRASDADIFAIVDRLAYIDRNGTRKALADAEQTFGLNHTPAGVLSDPSMRARLQPLTHWCRDWMHVLVVDGVANIEVEQLYMHLKEVARVDLYQVQSYCNLFTLPSGRGRINQANR